MNILTTLKNNTRSFYHKSKTAIAYGTLALAAAVTCAPQARATDIDDLFTAVNITGLQSNVKTFLIGFAGLIVLFLGWKYLKRGAARA